MTALGRILGGKRRLAALGVVALVLAGAVVYVEIAAATATVTSGSATETADQASAGTWVTLAPNIAVTEGARGDFGGNTAGTWGATNLVLTPPSGWQFNASQTITPTRSGPDITGATATVAAGGTSITVTLTGAGRTNGTNDTFALPGVQVRPTATTPLSTGTIGCSSVNNVNGITCGTTTFGTLTETAGALSKLTITSVPASATAGSNFSVTVKSTDAYGNPVNVGSNTAIQLNPSGTGTISNNTGTITSGTNSVTLATVQYTKAESLTLVAHRTSGAVLADSASSSAITVNPGAFAKLQLLVPGETAAPGSGTGKTGSPSGQTSGSSFSVTAKAVDANWNVVTSATDTVGITSSDANASLPANAALVAGTKAFSVALKTSGSRTVTATDISDGTKTANTSPSITVNAGAFAKLQLLVPGETASPGSASGKTGTPSAQAAGTSFNVTVNAVDANWNAVSSTDTVGITSSDTNASLPANAALVGGAKTFSVTLKTAGSRTVTATDATDGSKTSNTSPGITVNPGSFAKLQLLVPGETADPGSASGKTGSPSAHDQGSAFTVTVNAVDASWNPVSSTDTVGITSSDPAATLPSNAALVGGTKTFSLTLSTPGSRTLTATDASDGSKSANTSPGITVNDITPPTFSSAAVNGTALAATFSENLDAASVPAASAWTVARNGTAMADPANVSISGAVVTLTLASPIRNGDTVTLAYSQPGSNKLRDPSSNNAASFGAQLVTNSTASIAPDVPALVSPAAGLEVNATPTLAATFSDTDTNNTGQLTFQICADSSCASVVTTLTSPAGLANGASGSATVPGGTFTSGGTFYWRVKATDDTSAVSAYSATRSFVVDSTAPALQTATVNGTTLTLTYDEALDAGSVPATVDYGLHLNGGSAVAPTNVSVSGAAVTLTFAAGTVHNADAVRLDYTAGVSPVRDALHNDSGNLTNVVVANNTASLDPDVPALASPAAGARLSSATPSLSATFTDPDPRNTGQLTFQVCAEAACSSVLATFSSAGGVTNGADGSASVPGGTITTDGTYHWRAKATDDAGAFSAYGATRSFVVDTAAPTFASADVDGTALVVTMSEALDTSSTPAAGAWTVVRNGSTLPNATTVGVSGSTVTLTLASAVHYGDTVTAAYTQPGSNRLRDLAANDATSFGAQPVANTTASAAPDVPSLVSPANGAALASLQPTLTASFSDPDAANTGQLAFQLCSDAACSSPVGADFTSPAGVANGADGSAAAPAGRITTDGTYYWRAKAMDDTGASSSFSGTRSFTVDTTAPPLPTIDAGPAAASTSGKDVSFSFSDGEGGVTFEVQLDNGGWASAASPHAYTNLSDGSHTFEVRAKDALDNTSAPRTRTWTVDATPPPVPTIDSGPAGGTYSAADPAFGFSDSEGGVTFEVQLDGGGWSSATNPKSYTGLSQASHTFAVRVTDPYGNASGATSRTWNVDATAPSASLDDPGPYLRGTVTLAASAGDTGGSGIDSVAFQSSTGGPWTTIGTDSDGAPYSTAFDTTTGATPDGLYDLRVVVTDGAGNQTVSAVVGSRRIDNTAPGANLDDPGAYLRGTVNLNSSSGDAGSGVASTTYQYFQQSAGGPWTTTPAAFDTTTGSNPDGFYDLRVVVTDNAGNSATDTITGRLVDNTPPAATLDDPGRYLRGSITFTSTTADPGGSGVASVAYQQSPAGAGSFVTVPQPWLTTPADDGIYDVRVRAADNAGNVTNSLPVTNVVVDNTAPSVSVTSPAAGAPVTGTVGITINATDGGSGVQSSSIEFAHHGVGDWTVTPAAWDTTLLADGLYDLRAKATDRAGNNATSGTVANVLVDNQAPTVSFTTPSGGQYVNAASADPRTLTAVASDAGSGVASVEFFACSDASAGCGTGTWTSLGAPDTTAPFDGSWPVSADGNRALKAVATDNVGRTASAVVDVTVDRTAPDTTLLTKPGDPSNAGSPSFTFDSSETGSSFECSLDGGPWSACTSPDTIGPLADGSHTFDVRATDAAGNTDATSASWTWLVDLTPPTATMGDPGRNVRGTVALTSTQTDPGASASGIAAVAYEYSADGSTWAGTPAGWDTTLVSDGVYQLHVVVTDNAGNVTTSTAVADVRVDNTPPTTSADDPGANLRQTVSVTGSATDAGSGVTQVDFQISPAGANAWTTFGSAAAAPYSAPLDTTAYADGLYDVRTVATDAAGNVTQGAPVLNRRIDNTPPTASLTSPGSPLRGTVPLSSTSGDGAGSGVATVVYEASRNGGAYAPIAQNWNTITSGDGTYDLHLVVTDVAGNVTTSAALSGIVVDNTAPTTTDDAPAGWQSSPVTVTLSASDAGSGVSTTKYSVDGGGWQTGSSVSVPTADGSHTIAYYSVDAAGNVESSKSATVLMQTTPPSCPSCTAADYLRGTVTLTASPTTTSGGAQITNVVFKYQNSSGGPVVTIGSDATAPYSVDWDTTGVPDAGYDLIYEVHDAANNVSTTTIGSRVVDNTAPTAAVGSPAPGTVVSGTVSFGASVTDANLATVDYYVNGSQVGSTGGAAFSWNTSSVADGNASLSVVATDRAGNSTASPAITVVVDNDPPTISVAAPPVASGTVTVTASASADTSSVEFQRRALPAGAWTPFATDAGAPYSADLVTTALPDGDYEIRGVATDNGGHATASGAQPTKIDNTAPIGSIATPAGGAVVGGNVTLTASANDATSGVASVAYELRPTGGASFTSLGSASSSPYGVTWNAGSVASGSYDLRIAITDNAGNVFRSAPITIVVDSTPPGVDLESPGAVISGAVTLRATTSGTGATRVVFAISAAGANSWTDLATDTSEPWSASLDTTRFDEGTYDLRATVYDGAGNFQSSVRSNVVIDNRSPTLVSSTPTDGSIVAAADAIELVASETPAGIDNAKLDGVAAAAPILGGAHATFNTGTLATGAHTLTGALRDPAGHTGAFAVHFTVRPSGTALPDPPAVETNTSNGAPTTVTASDGSATVTMPAGAWPTGGANGDWVVLHVDPLPGLPSALLPGFDPVGRVLEVTAHWALSGTEIHQFDAPLEILFAGTPAKSLPLTDEGRWRVVPPLQGPTLPDSQPDGFFRDARGTHVATHHLTRFLVANDIAAPSPPTDLHATFGDDGMTLRWTAGKDNSGYLAAATVFADGQSLVDAGSATAAMLGRLDSTDTRAFTVVQTDLAGNVGAPSRALRVLPDLKGMTLAQARVALGLRGLTVGRVTFASTSGVKPGTIARPDGLSAAEEGTAIDLVVAAQRPRTKLSFTVVAPARVTGGRLTARINLSKRATVSAGLYDSPGRNLKTWTFPVGAGATTKTLRLPTSAERPARYKLVWTARSGGESLKRTTFVRLVAERTTRPKR